MDRSDLQQLSKEQLIGHRHVNELGVGERLNADHVPVGNGHALAFEALE